MARTGDSVLLEKRPPSGIWGGLWSFPEFEPGADIEPALWRQYGVRIEITDTWDVVRHNFTHFHLDISPVQGRVKKSDDRVLENSDLVWYNLHEPDARGLAAPVKKLLDKLR